LTSLPFKGLITLPAIGVYGLKVLGVPIYVSVFVRKMSTGPGGKMAGLISMKFGSKTVLGASENFSLRPHCLARGEKPPERPNAMAPRAFIRGGLIFACTMMAYLHLLLKMPTQY